MFVWQKNIDLDVLQEDNLTWKGESPGKSLVLFSFCLLTEPGVKGPGVVCGDGVSL